ncbi:unnamed protein product [Ectocarpus sp. 12 AP-2014]
MKLFVAIAALLSLSNAAVLTVAPGESIQAQIELAQPGDTIQLKDGKFAENLQTTRDGEENKPITLTGSRKAILSGTGEKGRMFEVNHDHWHIDGFTVDGKIGEGDKEEHFIGKLIYVHGNRETRTIKRHGTEFRSAIDGLVVSNMKLVNGGGECLRLRYFVTGAQIYGNYIENCGVWDFVFGGMSAVNSESIYIGTSSNQISDGKNPTGEIDGSRFIHVHHNVLVSEANECDVKEGSEYVLIEYNSCSTQKDPNSACVDSRSDHVIFRYNDLHDNDGAGVRIGGHTVSGKVWGLNNEVYGNTFRSNKEGALKLQTGEKEHPHLCKNTCKDGCKVGGTASAGNEDIEKKCDGVMEIFWVDDAKAVPDAVSPSVEAKSADGEPEDEADADADQKESPEADFEATVQEKPDATESTTCFPVPIADVKASSEQGKNTVHAAIDGKALTRWSAKGAGEWLEMDLASPQKINAVEVSFFKGDERTQSFEVAVDGDTVLKKQESDGKTLALERFPFPKAVEASSVTIKGGGNSKNEWNSLTEVIVCGVEEVNQSEGSAKGSDKGVAEEQLCEKVESWRSPKLALRPTTARTSPRASSTATSRPGGPQRGRTSRTFLSSWQSQRR